MSRPEQAESRVRVSAHGSVTKASRYHRHLKREGVRLMRRLGKLLLDDAPRRLPVRGYET